MATIQPQHIAPREQARFFNMAVAMALAIIGGFTLQLASGRV